MLDWGVAGLLLILQREVAFDAMACLDVMLLCGFLCRLSSDTVASVVFSGLYFYWSMVLL